mmetsp:Transcript_57363/g.171100  ORF Transcript_57363/g.171100 Transcript_57363/m.171100 type:complete len:246 (-) Transcript_57363:366-1103(-)
MLKNLMVSFMTLNFLGKLPLSLLLFRYNAYMLFQFLTSSVSPPSRSLFPRYNSANFGRKYNPLGMVPPREFSARSTYRREEAKAEISSGIDPSNPARGRRISVTAIRGAASGAVAFPPTPTTTTAEQTIPSHSHTCAEVNQLYNLKGESSLDCDGERSDRGPLTAPRAFFPRRRPAFAFAFVMAPPTFRLIPNAATAYRSFTSSTTAASPLVAAPANPSPPPSAASFPPGAKNASSSLIHRIAAN